MSNKKCSSSKSSSKMSKGGVLPPAPKLPKVTTNSKKK